MVSVTAWRGTAIRLERTAVGGSGCSITSGVFIDFWSAVAQFRRLGRIVRVQQFAGRLESGSFCPLPDYAHRFRFHAHQVGAASSRFATRAFTPSAVF